MFWVEGQLCWYVHLKLFCHPGAFGSLAYIVRREQPLFLLSLSLFLSLCLSSLRPSSLSHSLSVPLSYSLYTMQLMLECKTVVTDRLAPLHYNEPVTYTRIGREALGFVGKWAVDLAVLGCNLGVCAGYMIFIANNMQVRRGVWLGVTSALSA